jgi:hypothetical protein
MGLAETKQHCMLCSDTIESENSCQTVAELELKNPDDQEWFTGSDYQDGDASSP